MCVCTVCVRVSVCVCVRGVCVGVVCIYEGRETWKDIKVKLTLFIASQQIIHSS